jgi:hypothetical protein
MHSGLQFGLPTSHESPCPLWGRSFDSGRYSVILHSEHRVEFPKNVTADLLSYREQFLSRILDQRLLRL